MKCKICGVKTIDGPNGVPLEICEHCEKKLETSSLRMAYTFKFSTVVWLLLGLIVPFWIITLPLFWFFAYLSYSSGVNPNLIPKSPAIEPAPTNLDELKKLKQLLDSGAITNEEFENEKKALLSSQA